MTVYPCSLLLDIPENGHQKNNRSTSGSKRKEHVKGVGWEKEVEQAPEACWERQEPVEMEEPGISPTGGNFPIAQR